jgi:hypothetical protein
MNTRSSKAAGVLSLAAMVAAIPATAATESDVQVAAKGCAARFEEAQRQDMESFRDYDARRFRAVHHPDAVTIFASGHVFYGVDEIMRALQSHFENREAIWAWTELYRLVDGCKSAFILYDATYDIPSSGYHQRTLTGVTYTYHRGRWLATADQGAYLEAPAQ